MSVWGPTLYISQPQENGIKILWTEMWEVEYFLTLLAEPSQRTPADHDCVCELGLVGHLGWNDPIAGHAEGLEGSWDTSNKGSAVLQTGSGMANLTLETGWVFNVLWFSHEEHTLNAHRAENGSVEIHIPIQISQLPTPGLPKSPCLVSVSPAIEPKSRVGVPSSRHHCNLQGGRPSAHSPKSFSS